MKPDVNDILAQAKKLQSERFSTRDKNLTQRHKLRFRQLDPEVPTQYKNTATVYKTPVIQEEGRQLDAILNAKPQVKVIPPKTEDQATTTKIEKWVAAAHQELEACYGHVWNRACMAQIHEDIGWIYTGMKRKPYAGQPSPPQDENDIMASLDFQRENDQYKREAGIDAVFDYRHVPTGTVYYVGEATNPLAVYEIKVVDEQEMMLQYGVYKDSSGKYVSVSGEPESYGRRAASGTCTIYEYWDREWCIIFCGEMTSKWMNIRKQETAFVLEEWHHGWGRTPYFAAPAFENETRDPEFAFESPLNGLYAEAPNHNQLRTMLSNVGYLVGYPSWQIVTKESGDQILDDSGNPKVALKFEPGMMVQLAPGQQVAALPMATGSELQAEALASEARMRQYSLADIAKGVAPGADTANSAISQLRRLQRSSLERLADNRARQIREMYKFWLQIVKGEKGEGVGETVYVYSEDAGEMVGIDPEDIITMNVQVKVAPDTGSDALIEEKQAAELKQIGLISELEFHERRGKENPEEYVRANVLERLWMLNEQTLQAQVMANLGDTQAISRLIAANQQTGDARSAVQGIMADVAARQNANPTGMGSGSGMMPRQEGVRSPAVQQTTQPMQAMGG